VRLPTNTTSSTTNLPTSTRLTPSKPVPTLPKRIRYSAAFRPNPRSTRLPTQSTLPCQASAYSSLAGLHSACIRVYCRQRLGLLPGFTTEFVGCPSCRSALGGMWDDELAESIRVWMGRNPKGSANGDGVKVPVGDLYFGIGEFRPARRSFGKLPELPETEDVPVLGQEYVDSPIDPKSFTTPPSSPPPRPPARSKPSTHTFLALTPPLPASPSPPHPLSPQPKAKPIHIPRHPHIATSLTSILSRLHFSSTLSPALTTDDIHAHILHTHTTFCPITTVQLLRTHTSEITPSDLRSIYRFTLLFNIHSWHLILITDSISEKGFYIPKVDAVGVYHSLDQIQTQLWRMSCYSDLNEVFGNGNGKRDGSGRRNGNMVLPLTNPLVKEFLSAAAMTRTNGLNAIPDAATYDFDSNCNINPPADDQTRWAILSTSHLGHFILPWPQEDLQLQKSQKSGTDGVMMQFPGLGLGLQGSNPRRRRDDAVCDELLAELGV
jgi:hypothetical protein